MYCQHRETELKGPQTPANSTTASLHSGTQRVNLESPEKHTPGHTVREGDKGLNKNPGIWEGACETPCLHKNLRRRFLQWCSHRQLVHTLGNDSSLSPLL